MGTTYLFNTTIIPNTGIFNVEKISEEQVKNLTKNEFTSAIGHESTAKVFSILLEKEVSVNRIHAELGCLDKAVCLKIKGRLPEGKILTIDDIKEIGYEFFLIERID